MQPVLDVDNLHIQFPIDGTYYSAVEKLSFSIQQGETLGLVGESGCGKSVSSLAIMRLLQKSTRVTGKVKFLDKSLLELPEDAMRKVRGNQVGMIFQEPMTSLNPVLRVGDQVSESLILHRGLSKRQAWARSVELLDKVGMPNPKQVADGYPHQLSGGMRQRVMIAIAMACEPALLIADEPTTALDVTVQAQILDLMRKLAEEHNTAILFITHDLGVVAQMCNRVAVMYAGRIVEHGSVHQIFENPCHPYTLGLLNSVPRIAGERTRLEPIPGNVPSITNMPHGCKFKPRRCPHPELCRDEEPDLFDVEPGHQCRMWEYAPVGVK
jgi:oligopeptide/dipeptide ABC transporter ATP-binding protein